MSKRTAGAGHKQHISAPSSFTQRFSDWLGRSHAGTVPYTPLWIFAVLLLAALLVISTLAQPIADDFEFLMRVPHQPIIGTLRTFYLHRDGRYANAIVEVAGAKLFGAMAVKVVPILEIVALVAASTWLLWQLLGPVQRRLERAALLGSAFTGVLLLVVPSIFDSVAWYNASSIYTVSLSSMVLTMATYVYLCRHHPLRWYHYAAFGLLAFFSQGFNEPAAIITCLIVSFLLLRALVGKSKTSLITAIWLVGAVAGFAIDYLSPATHNREKYQHAALNFHNVFFNSLRDFLYTKHTLLSWRVTLIAVLGLAFALAIPELSKQMRKRLVGIGIVLCVAPTYITGILTHYANSAEGGMTETRTATVPFAFLVAGLVCLVVALVQSLPRRERCWLPLALYIAVPVCLAVSLQPVLNVVRAEILRDSLLRYRAASIQAQVAAHQQTIYIIPAPILLDDSQAVDLSYGNHQIDWLVFYLAEYYGLQGKTIKIVNMQPPGYCLTHSGAAWWGAYTCQANATQQVQAVPYAPNVSVTK